MSKFDESSTKVDAVQIEIGARDVERKRLAARVEEIKREIVLLEQQLVEARKAADEERAKPFGLWKQKVIGEDEFMVLVQKIYEKADLLFKQIRKKHTEYRLVRINFLTHAKPPDDLRQRVMDLNVKANLHRLLQGKDIQAGGSNALGVFEIENGEFVLIKKPKGEYEFEGALPYLMQDIGTKRIPRVLEVFETDDANYKVMEKAKGVQLDTLSADEVVQIPQEHFDHLIKHIAGLDGLGLQIDPSKRSNFFYDNAIGFSIIDLLDSHCVPMRKDVRSNVNLDDLKGVLPGSWQDPIITCKIEEAIKKQSTADIKS